MTRERVIVAGSRTIDDYKTVKRVLTNHFTTGSDRTPLADRLVVLSGCADGVDTHAIEWANSLYIDVDRYPAEWDTHGKRAGFIRNQEMAEAADTLVAIWDGDSAGTRDMITRALDEGLETHVYPLSGLERYGVSYDA